MIDLYAQALYQSAQDVLVCYDALDSLNKVTTSIERFVNRCEQSQQFYGEVLEIFEETYPKELVSFINVLYEDGMLRQIPRILEYYRDELINDNKLCVARIEMSKELSNQFKERIEALIKEEHPMRLEMTYVLNEDLIGGLRVTINHQQFDLSYLGKLQSIVSEVRS
ncbi:F0F1 ATP synthase subunit delta [Erysipelothrix sp. HDW6A]|uniref:F0F1 ATP synthase subunit delta n=1 Tax=Erysipelothrix sp. HDW6A TaxID=2714928 RepID=UPI00140A4E13|nr:F0F1 ATP synthase subunit delta [Erysipelothrix sp. HDW6A]QIK58138.1 F0F1 ATP synthase subunit delta [Erysipelothrix sp. HDW6A]